MASHPSTSLGKRHRHRHGAGRQHDVHRVDRYNVSASQWGAADGSESDGTSEASISSDEDDEEATALPVHEARMGHSTEETHRLPRKRRHLDASDVGRFADMAIDPSRSPRPPQEPTEVVMPSSPNMRPVLEAYPSTNSIPLAEVTATEVEEPGEDLDMRTRRGPQTVQLDSNRFFVSSLSDSSSDEEDAEEEREQERVDRILNHSTKDQLREAMAGAAAAHNRPDMDHFLINGELVSRLRALDWQRRADLAPNKAAQPLFAQPPQAKEADQKHNSLILWRRPDEISLNFGRTESPTVAPHVEAAGPSPTTASQGPPIVLDDGQYAYVRRPIAAAQILGTSPGEGMEVD